MAAYISDDSDQSDIDIQTTDSEFSYPLRPYMFEPIVPQTNSGLQTQRINATDSTPEIGISEDRRNSTDWCSCGNCDAMPSHLECVCCQEMDVLKHKLTLRVDTGTQCITTSDTFKAVCLDRDVLDVSLLMMKDFMVDEVIRPVQSR